MVTGHTKLLGIIGNPVEHSLSPAMQNAALTEMELDFIYLPFPVASQGIEAALLGFEAIGVVGFNVTIPHKQAIVPYLAQQTEVAQAVGAVNTVLYRDGGWWGTNTDVAGFIAPLREISNWGDRTAVILGNGGAARAVVAGLTQLGCGAIRVVGRDEQNLTRFAESWQASSLGVQLTPHLWESLPELLPQTHLLVNTTPVGMGVDGDRSPLSAADVAQLGRDSIVYDLIYTPRPTKLLQLAQERGLRAIDGTEMLVQQGAAALSLWTEPFTSKPVPVNIMRDTLLSHLS
ncbi:shikimate dehydrogenase [Sodalinema gerasimenkoae]|uniref:shikimate dehydrogenase n=1 Tax=Sodalinema gerasimenkoae TaxID=2862348 RepID=UPI0013581285|nr:shikimate dehydrogenase [Sodalinema gerasimenkoae]